MPAIGTKAVLNGKPVRWSGENYGWQSFGSHDKLKREGKFKLGAQLLDRLGNAIQNSQVTKNLLQAQQQFRNATKFVEPVENLVNKGVKADDKLPGSRVAQGGAVLAGRAANAANVDPRLAMVPMLLTGGLSFGNRLTGKKPNAAPPKWINDLGTDKEWFDFYKLDPSNYRNKDEALKSLNAVHTQSLRDHMNGKSFNSRLYDAGTYTDSTPIPPGYKRSPEAEAALAAKKALFESSYPKPIPAPIPSTKVQNPPSIKVGKKPAPIPNPSTKVQKPKPEPIQVGKKPAPIAPELAQRRFTPMDKDPSITESRSQIDKRVRNPDLPRDLAPADTTPPVPLGELKRDMVPDSPTRGQLTIGPYEPGTAKAGQAYANAHLSVDGSGVALPFKVAETQAHHSTIPLKDTGDFTRGFNDEQMAIFRAKTEAAGIYAGDTQLNTAYLRQPYHQGNKVWPEAKQSAVHPNLQSRVLEAKASQDRWAHMTPEERLANIDYFIEDALLGQRLAQEAEFAQTLLQAGNNAFNNPFGGNISQSVLAPLNKANLVEISNKRRKARSTLKDKMMERSKNNAKP